MQGGHTSAEAWVRKGADGAQEGRYVGTNCCITGRTIKGQAATDRREVQTHRKQAHPPQDRIRENAREFTAPWAREQHRWRQTTRYARFHSSETERAEIGTNDSNPEAHARNCKSLPTNGRSAKGNQRLSGPCYALKWSLQRSPGSADSTWTGPIHSHWANHPAQRTRCPRFEDEDGVKRKYHHRSSCAKS